MIFDWCQVQTIEERKNPYFWHSALLEFDIHVVPVLFHLKPANGLVLTGLWYPCAGVCVFVCDSDSVWGTEADNSERSIDSQKHSHWIYSHLGHVQRPKYSLTCTGQNNAISRYYSHKLLSLTPKQAPFKVHLINKSFYEQQCYINKSTTHHRDIPVLDKFFIVFVVPVVILFESFEVFFCIKCLAVIVGKHQATFSTNSSFTHLKRRDTAVL